MDPKRFSLQKHGALRLYSAEHEAGLSLQPPANSIMTPLLLGPAAKHAGSFSQRAGVGGVVARRLLGSGVFLLTLIENRKRINSI